MKNLALCLLLLLLAMPGWAQDWTTSQVILLGESHDSKADHEGQLAALQALRKACHKPLVIAAEMFREDGRAALTQYAERSDFQDFEESYWKEQWGHPYALYQPLWKWTKESGATLVDLRPSPERTEQFKKEGVTAAIPWFGEFYLGPAGYREVMAKVAARHLPTEVPITPELVDRYFLIQCFWEEYMTWRILELRKLFPEATIVVLVGHGHLHPEFGIPARLRRRDPHLSVSTLGFDRSEEWQPDLWYSP